MRLNQLSLALSLAAVCAVPLSSLAQIANEKPGAFPAASAPTAVPSLVPYAGTALDAAGKPLTGEIGVTFLIFKDEQGGEPLFSETQSVALNAAGHYKVQLGATLANGLPADLFATGEARWLEIQVAGQAPQSRVLLTSVPYALKAADATTFNGLPLSAFVLAGSRAATALQTEAITAAATTTASTVTTTGGTSGTVPLFTGAATIANANIFQNTTGIGINTSTPATTLDVNGPADLRGAVNITRNGTATATAGANSFPLTLSAQVYNSSTRATVNPAFEWQAAPTGNNTASPAAALDLLYSNGTTTAATGFSFNANGTINFASGQTFPGTGDGSITGVTAGTGLTGGGTSGKVTLNVDTTKVPLLAASTNTFTGSQSVGGNLSVQGNQKITGSLNAAVSVSTNALTAGSGSFTQGLTSSGMAVPAQGSANFGSGVNSYPIDLHSSIYGVFDPGPLTTDFRLQAESSYNGTYGVDQNSLNLLFGSTSQPLAETGFSIAANGALNATALNTQNLTASQAAGNIISSPAMVIQADDNGVSRSAAQQLSIQGATLSGQQLLIGYISDANSNSNGGLATIQSTWTGVENTPLALQPNGGACVCISTGLDGALKYQYYPLVVGQGAGPVVADAYYDYSSRRFKTDIQTLPDALDKVEQLRGVSYTLKANGKHEIGLIAEEVGAVVPSVVEYEANGKDAKGVDYGRLTALLIEATKEQQAEIASTLKQIKQQKQQIHQQAASIAALKSQVSQANENLRKVSRQLAASQTSATTIAMSSIR